MGGDGGSQWAHQMPGSDSVGSTPGESSPVRHLLNIYFDRSDLVLIGREGGTITRHRVPAEASCWIEHQHITRSLARMLRDSDRVKAMERRDQWWRIVWADRQICEEYCDALHKKGIPTCEGSVSPLRSWCADNQIQIAKPRRVYLDIETDSRLPFSRKEEMRVLCWSLVDEQGGHTERCLVEDSDEAEAVLLAHLWRNLQPFDQVLSWNGNRFDFPVVRARTKRMRLDIDARRWLWLDHMDLFRRYNMMAAESGDEKQSMALQAIAMATLGEGKDPFDASKTWEAWAAGGAERERMVRYCHKDTDLMRRIEEKTGYVELLQTLCEATGTFPDSRGVNPGAQVENFLLRLGRERGYRFPTRFAEESSKYRGAYVMEPKTKGILRDVHVCDFSSMYPSIILTWNMSLETKGVGDERSKAAITGIEFATDREGILPAAVAELLRLRKAWNERKAVAVPGTDEWKDADRRSTAYKIAANTFYGVVGAPMSRLFDREVAESVAQCGVWLIQETIKAAEARGMQAVYADSVTGDRTVVAKDGHGDVHMMPIAELFERATEMHSSRGKQFAHPAGWRALAVDSTGMKGWYPIEAVIRHRAGKPTYRITTKHGQTQVTSDHGIMVDGFETTPLEFVRDSSQFTKVDPHVPSPVGCIDLLQYVRDHVYEFENPKHGHVVRRLVASADLQRIVLDGWGDYAEPSFQRFYHRGSESYEALLRLVSAYVCDGSASIAGKTAVRHALSFCKSDEELMCQLADDLGMLMTGAKVYGPYWTETVYVVRSCTALMPNLFAALCGVGSKGKRFPPFVFDLNADAAAVVVDGLAKGDGSIDAAGQLCFSSSSQQLAAGVSYLLAQHSKPHSFCFRESKQAWAMRTRKGKERPSRYSIKSEKFDPDPEQWVYDLSVEGAHTFVDGIGRVLLHNTDGAYVMGCTRDEFGRFVDWCNEKLYPPRLVALGCKVNHIRLAYEKAFDRITFSCAKKYCGSLSHFKGTEATAESKPEIKGLEFKRGDSVRLARELQEEIVYMLVGYQREPSEDPEDYEQVINRWRERILDDEIVLDDVVVSKRLAKPLGDYAVRMKLNGQPAAQSPHIEIAKLLKERGRDVGEGVKIAYVCTDGGRSPKMFIPAEDWSGDCDRHELWDGLVWPPTRRVLEAAFPGHGWERWDRTRPHKRRGRPPLPGQMALPWGEEPGC